MSAGSALRGYHPIVTGGSSGIGRALARSLSGAHVGRSPGVKELPLRVAEFYRREQGAILRQSSADMQA